METKSWILEISLEDDEIFMEQNIPVFYETIDYEKIRKCFDLDCVNIEYSIAIVSIGIKDILFPVKNEESLNKLNPNFDKSLK